MMALWICKLPYRVSWCLEETQGNKEEEKKRDKENYVKAGFGFTLMGFHFQTGHTFRKSRLSK